MLEGKDPGPTSFSIDNGIKDLRTMIATGESLGAEMRATKAALSTFEEASKAGIGGGDGAKMTVFWSDKKK
jgi:3-hydroxyisobutyrate dehydrogenase-like beta-hydroxyacid dehydrogenase